MCHGPIHTCMCHGPIHTCMYMQYCCTWCVAIWLHVIRDVHWWGCGLWPCVSTMTSALFIGHTDKTPLLEGALINYVALKSPVNLSQSPVHLSVPSPPITVPSPPIPVPSPPIPVPSPLIPVPSPVIPVPSPHISELYQHYLCLSPPPPPYPDEEPVRTVTLPPPSMATSTCALQLCIALNIAVS